VKRLFFLVLLVSAAACTNPAPIDAVSVSPSKIVFASASAPPQNVTVSQSYSGGNVVNFTVDLTYCGKVVSVKDITPQGATAATYQISPKPAASPATCNLGFVGYASNGGQVIITLQ
jgi:hypothetical protein